MKIFSVNNMPNTIIIGRQTEYGVNEVRIDCAPWLAIWPDMQISVWVTPPNGDGAYPADTHMEGDLVVWKIGAADTNTSGSGYVEIMGLAEGKKKLSASAATKVLGTTTGTTTEPPEAHKAWVEEVARSAMRAEDAAKKAEESAAEIGAALGEKLDRSGYSPNMYLGTDENGNVIEKTAAEGGGSNEALPPVTEEDNGKILTVVGGEWAASELPRYSGMYEVTPKAIGSTTLETAQTFVESDIVVKQIPYYQTSNDSDGDTVYIGTEVEIYGN